MGGPDHASAIAKEEEARAAIDARLPRRRCSAGLLLCDDRGHVLLVKPAYRTEWMIPGGIVEAGETPAEAAIREVQEETGLTVCLTALLCIDIVPSQGGFSESVHFLFAGAVDYISHPARADGNEILQVEFVEPVRAPTLLPEHVGRRLTSALAGHVGYYEHGRPMLPFAAYGDALSTQYPLQRNTP